ncbi:AI-2E family transporter [Peptoniphilaceae bacterium SGI.131]
MRLSPEEKRSIYIKLFIVFVSIVMLYFAFNLSNVKHYFLYIVSVARPVILGLALAYLINMLLKPIERFLLEKIKIKSGKRARNLALLLSYLLFLAVIALVFSLVLPQFVESILNLIYQLPNMVRDLIGKAEQYEIFSKVTPKVEEYLNKINTNELAKMAINFVTGGAGIALNGTINIISGIFTSVFDVFLVLVFSIYTLSSKEQMIANTKKLTYSVLPEKFADYIVYVARLLNKNFSNFFTGQVIEAVIVGTIVFIGMNILRLPFAPMLAVLTAFMNLIPYIGATLGAIIGFVILAMESPIQALVYLVFVIVVQQIDGNIIYPRLVGNRIGISAFWIILAVTVGGAMMGILGMVVFVPLVSTLYMILRDFTRSRLASKNIDIKNK